MFIAKPILLAAAVAAGIAVHPAAAANFPETAALQGELTGLQTSYDNLAKRLERSEKQVGELRVQVGLARALVAAIAKTDDSMARIIKELKTLSAVPQLKMLPPAIKLLENIRKQVHAIRLKSDKFDADALKPLEARIKLLQKDHTVAILQLKASLASTKAANAGLTESRKLIEQRGRPAAEVAALEAAAKLARGSIKPTIERVAVLDKSSAELEAAAKSLVASLKAVTALRPGVDKVLKDLKPFNDAAAELKKVMAQKVSIDLLGIKHAFTVRQVLDGPKNVADIVLKPLQDLADKAIAEVMKAFKLELKAPPELTALVRTMETAAADAAKFPAAVDLNVDALKTCDQALAKLKK